MGMFDDSDFQKILDGYDEGIPDGYVDASSTVKVFEEFVDSLATLNVDDSQSKILFMMRVVNMVNRDDPLSSFEVLSAATFHIINLITIGRMIDEEFMNKYIDMLYNQALPTLRDTGGSFPYWD